MELRLCLLAIDTLVVGQYARLHARWIVGLTSAPACAATRPPPAYQKDPALARNAASDTATVVITMCAVASLNSLFDDFFSSPRSLMICCSKGCSARAASLSDCSDH